MNRVSRKAMQTWVAMGPKFLPFSDAATEDLPLPRLLRLSLFQVTVGMALVLMIGTLNRVMIVELDVPASIVAVMISMPLLFAPFRALIGHRSDNHRSALGWRRVPYIWRGTMIQFGGLAMMPFAILVLSRTNEAANSPEWIGWLGAGLAFLLVGAGLHMIQTVGLALATDLAPVESRPKVVGLMYVMLLVGMIISAACFGLMLQDFSPMKLIQAVQGAAVLTIVLNITALWKQEPRDRRRAAERAEEHSFRRSFASFLEGGHATRRLMAVGLGTMGFSMEDVLLEPYGGQVLHLPVAATTVLTAALAVGGLFGFWLASRILGRGYDPFRMACWGAAVGMPAFACVIMAAPAGSAVLFGVGTLCIGIGAGLFGHGTLTATMNLAPPGQSGLALGAWGAVQATAAGLAVAAGGIIRDVVAGMDGHQWMGTATGYVTVYVIELALLAVTLLSMLPLLRQDRRTVLSRAVKPTGSPMPHRPA